MTCIYMCMYDDDDNDNDDNDNNNDKDNIIIRIVCKYHLLVGFDQSHRISNDIHTHMHTHTHTHTHTHRGIVRCVRCGCRRLRLLR